MSSSYQPTNPDPQKTPPTAPETPAAPLTPPLFDSLVSAGADIHAQTLDDLTPLDWAARNGHVPCLVALHDAAKHLESIPKQPPGSVTTFSRSGEVVEVRVTRPDTTGRELLTPWARFGKFEWLQKGPSHM